MAWGRQLASLFRVPTGLCLVALPLAAECGGMEGAPRRSHHVAADHFHVDVRTRLPTETHFLHGLAWKDHVSGSLPLVRGAVLDAEWSLQGLEKYDTFLGEKSLVSEVRWGKNACGHAGLVHGGAIAATFDDAFGALFFSLERGKGFTARLEINYRKPIPAGTPLRVVTAVESVEGRKVWMTSKMVAEDGETAYADARSLFVVARVPSQEELKAAQKSV
jgi:uncharacterized protein (TIGR00369 family)